MTKRAGRSVSNDPGFQATLQAHAGAICLVAKAWDYHVRVALGISNEENLEGITQSIEAVVRSNREAMLDCEHFFDGYKANRAYALAVATAAYKAGARWVVLCDTNGGTLPNEIAGIVSDVSKHVPGAHLGIHTHNDTENAVANTLVAVRAGRAPDPGCAQRARRALRQRQPRLHHPDAAAEERVRRSLRDQRDAGAAEEAHAREPPARRGSQSRAQPAGPLRRRGGVRHQGRHSRQRHSEGARHLRARAARERRQPPPRAGLGPGRQVEPALRAGAAGRAREPRRPARHASCSTR